MRTLAVSAMGLDRPGIIAGVAERLVAHGVNVTDSQMSILRGHFAMTLIVTAPDDVDEVGLAGDLRAAGDELGLEGLALRAVEDAHGGELGEPGFVVTVYGADHPGILAAISRTLADAGVNVCDLHTRLVGEASGAPVYVMHMEVAVPAGVDEDALRELLAGVATEQGVEVALHAVDADVL